VDKLGINLGFLLFQLFNFGLIFFLLARFVWPRVLRTLDERQERIAKGLEDARAAEEARANAERERDQILTQARSEGQRLLEEARQRGDEQVKTMAREATQDAEERRTQARTQAEEERNRILSESREQIVALAMAAAQRVVGETLDTAKQRTIIERFFTEVPADARNLGGRVEVVSALPLADKEKAEVQKVTGAQQVDYKVDPSILGGLVIRAGDKVIDGSVRGDMAALAGRLR